MRVTTAIGEQRFDATLSDSAAQAYYPGIVILGRLDETAAERISAMNGAVTATVEASGG
jgi:hypothetical protein